MSNMMTPSLQVSMNELSNHDHSRFLTRTNHRVGRVQELGAEAANENVNVAVMRGGRYADDVASAQLFIMATRPACADLRIQTTDVRIRGGMKIRS